MRSWLGMFHEGDQAAAKLVVVLPVLGALKRGHLAIIGLSFAQMPVLGPRPIRLLVQRWPWQLEGLVALARQVEVVVSLVVLIALEVLLVRHCAVEGGVYLV